MLIIRGLPYKIRNGGKVAGISESVLEINPHNIRANLLVALKMINAPKLFGGNPRRGIEVLSKVLEHPMVSTEIGTHDFFWYYLALGEGYAKINEKTKAREFYQMAIEMYPGNRDARELLSQL